VLNESIHHLRRTATLACATTTLALAATLSARPSLATAQQSDQEKRPSGTVLTRRDAAVAGGFVAASAVLSLFDTRIASFFGDTVLGHVQRGQRLDDIFTRVNETTLTAASILAYGIGRATRSQTITDVAFHSAEAIFAASIASQVIRGPLGRSRPHVTNFEDQYDFHFFRGFREFKYRAFPSIHSGSGFAAATVLVAETQRRNPDATIYVAPIAYALALTPGLSRMYLGQHWASDIFAGAFVGTFAGLKVVHYSHDRPGNRIDRIFIPGVRVSGSSRAFTVGWSGTF
jgi:membrane-associated phospholipid phosphatase